MKRRVGISILIMMMLVSFCACGKNAIEREWVFLSMTEAGDTLTASQLDKGGEPFVKFTVDGEKITFTVAGGAHTGKWTEKDGMYTISYDDTDNTMNAKVNGDKLEIKAGETIFTFEAK